MTESQISLILVVLGILGSGVGAWIGVRVAVARMQERLDNQRKDINENKESIRRLEDNLFFNRQSKGD